MSPLIWIPLFLIPIEVAGSINRVRSLALDRDQIATVRTAIGIATIIQVPDRPSSLVVGDTQAFKVEYLDQAITIKPLHQGAKSNLYIYTDHRRFNVQLQTGAEASADYVVYLKPRDERPPAKDRVKWSAIRKSLNASGLMLRVLRAGRTLDGVLLVEVQLSSEEETDVDPKWFWLTQQGASRPIHRLALSSLRVGAGSAATGTIEILEKDTNPHLPLRIELRKRKTAYLTLPEYSRWK